MKVYTRTGDDGTTGLFGGGRVSKDHVRIHAYGTVDELNAVIGQARASLPSAARGKPLDKLLEEIQNDLFVLGADLATPLGSKATVPRIGASRVERLERHIDRLDEALPPLQKFILPGGTETASVVHVARTVCRRAERLSVAADTVDSINHEVPIYLNRLSDLFFVLSRYINQEAGVADTEWVAEAEVDTGRREATNEGSADQP